MIDLLQIGHVRARSASLDRDRVIAARLRVSTALGSADLRPPGLPPSSILIVRAFSDQGEEGLLAEGRIPRPRTSWVRSTRAGLDAIARDAVRPRNGYLPSNATAVVFTDESEMLAALLADLANGTVDHWWWATVLARWPTWRAGVHRVLADRARRMPSIFAFLAAWGRIDSVAGRLEPRECSDLIRRLATAFEVPVPPLAVASFGWNAASTSASSTYSNPPWSSLFPTFARKGETTPVHECLLGLALMIQYRPLRARSPDYSRKVNRWLQECIQESAAGKWIATGDVTDRTRQPGGTSKTEGLNGEHALGDVESTPPIDDAESEVIIGASRQEASEEGAGPLPNRFDRSKGDPGHNAGTLCEEDVDTRLYEPVAPLFPSRLEVQSFSTELAGICYLINVMTDLGLPESLEQDWQLASRLGPWGTLDLIARGLIGYERPDAGDRWQVRQLHGESVAPSGASHHWGSDPIWTVLAQLGGYEPADGPTLLRPADPSSTGDRQQNDDPTNSVRAFIVPWIREILIDRLAVDADELLNVFFCRSGQVILTASHLDVQMSLASISRPVRMSGLDRDPGWLPAWGRVIRFHFN